MRHLRHHYVPKFLLRGWTGPDRKISCYRWQRARIIVSRLSPKNVASEVGLYSFDRGSNDQRQSLEREFFGQVDANAAKAMHMLLEGAMAGLDARTRADWALFLISLRVRSPRVVRDIRRVGTSGLLNVLAEDPEEYEKLRKEDDPPTLTEWLNTHGPGVIENFGLTVVPKLIQHDVLVNHVLRMRWWTQRVSGTYEFFISDHPCVFTKGFGDPDCVVALPLGPQTAFFAANRPDLEVSFRGKPDNALASRMNQSVVSQAIQYAYDMTGKRRLFVQKHLKRPSGARTPAGDR